MARSWLLGWLSSKFQKGADFFFCWRAYGLSNALKMNLLVGSTSFKRTIHLSSKKAGSLCFTFRGRKDRGVLSHLIDDGYLIEETEEHPVRTVMDCGANIGDETLRFFFHHPHAEITAVEADPDNFQILRENCRFSSRLKAIHGAAWREDTELRIARSEHGNPEASRVIKADGGAPVNAYSIESIMRMRGWRTVDILKFDIEGAEHSVFSGATDWLASVNCLIFEVPDSDRPGTLQLIFDKLAGSHWNGVSIGENLILIRHGLPWLPRRIPGVKLF